MLICVIGNKTMEAMTAVMQPKINNPSNQKYL